MSAIQKSPLNPLGIDETADDPKRLETAIRTLEWLNPLCENDHFRIFMERVVGPKMGTAREAALDVTLPKEARDEAAQRHFAFKQVFDAAGELRRAMLDVVQQDKLRREKAAAAEQKQAPPL